MKTFKIIYQIPKNHIIKTVAAIMKISIHSLLRSKLGKNAIIGHLRSINFLGMKSVKHFSFLIIFFLFSGNLKGQLYDGVVGLRLGVPLSISYKKIINENKAIEGYIGTRGKNGYRFINISGGYQIIEPIDLWGVEELYYYYGGGASIYFWSFKEAGNNQTVTPGLQGYLGLEYTFPDKPINITLDWVPTLFIIGHLSGLRGGYLSLGVRYVLSRDTENGNLSSQ